MALRGAWLGEIDQLTSTARVLSMAGDCADFVLRPNLPYVHDNFRRGQLAAARIDMVLIVNRLGRPLFWRSVDGGSRAGFADAAAFLARLPPLPRTRRAGVPGLAGAVQLASGEALVVAMPIPAASAQGEPRGWLVIGRKLDAAQWRRYADSAHVAASVVSRSAWPSEVRQELDQPLRPVIRVGSSEVRGFLALPDARGTSFQAFIVTAPASAAVMAAAAVDRPRKLAPWLPLAAVLLCCTALTWIVLRRHNRAAAGAGGGPQPIEPPNAAPPDPLPKGATMPLEAPLPVPSQVTDTPAAAHPDSPDPAQLIGMPIDGRGGRWPGAGAVADSVSARRHRLRAALTAIDIAFRYQPEVDLLTGRVSGVEALVFLKGASDDSVPTSLVTQLETAGLGLSLAERWLQDICSERRRWRRHIGEDYPIGMPVSLRTLEDPGFLPLALKALEEHDLPARFLELEVPESALDGSAAAARVLSAASEAGVLVAVDGFSGARSSLRALATLSLSKLRVDCALMRGSGGSARSARLFDAIVGAARGLEIPVCATSVDSPELLMAVELRGCALAQGIALGRPADGEQFLALVRGSGIDTASLPLAEVQEGLRRAAETATA